MLSICYNCLPCNKLPQMEWLLTWLRILCAQQFRLSRAQLSPAESQSLAQLLGQLGA